MFLFPVQRSSSILTSSGAIAHASSTPPGYDETPEVDTASSARCRQNSDPQRSADRPDADSSGSEVDVMTSRSASVADDDDEDDRCRRCYGNDDNRCPRCHNDGVATPSPLTSPSKELKFGIDRILVKQNDPKDTSPIGIVLSCLLTSLTNDQGRIINNVLIIDY